MSCPSIQERSARGLGWTELVGPGQRRVQAGVPFPLAVGALLALGAIARRQYAPEPSYERILEPASSVGRRPVHWHNPRWQCCGSVAVLVLMGRAPVSPSCSTTRPSAATCSGLSGVPPPRSATGMPGERRRVDCAPRRGPRGRHRCARRDSLNHGHGPWTTRLGARSANSTALTEPAGGGGE